FATLQAVGENIAREHAVGTIHNEHDIFAETLIHRLQFAPLRTLKRDANRGHCKKQQGIFKSATKRTMGACEFLDEARRSDLRELAASGHCGITVQRRE